MKPVFTEDGVNYVYVQHNNVYLVALTRKNSNVVMILVFLEKLIEVRRVVRARGRARPGALLTALPPPPHHPPARTPCRL